MRFLRFIKEAFRPKKEHHTTWMRANPVHAGHGLVVDSVRKAAGSNDHSIVLTSTHDKDKNPLSPDQKLNYFKLAFGSNNVKLHKHTVLHHMSDLHNDGVTHVHLHVGYDRANKFDTMIKKYNGRAAAHGYYKFKSITVHPVGGYRTSSYGTDSYSGTKMRQAARLNDRISFGLMAPPKMSTTRVDMMFNHVRRQLKDKKP